MVRGLGYSNNDFETANPGRLCRGRERWIQRWDDPGIRLQRVRPNQEGPRTPGTHTLVKSDTRRGPEPGDTWTILEVKEIPGTIIGKGGLAQIIELRDFSPNRNATYADPAKPHRNVKIKGGG